jgi:hypothetical protein
MSESVCAQATEWAWEHFNGISFGDRRLSKES